MDLRLFPFARLAMAVLVPMACTEISPREHTQGNQESIVGKSARADNTHDAVVVVMTAEGSICSGTVIRRNAEGTALYVLTAAHCCQSSDAPEKILTGTDYAQPSGTFPVASFQQHPCYNSLSNDYDVCVLQVKDAGALNVAPIPLAAAPDELTPGSSVTVVGYGDTPALNTLRRVAEAQLVETTPLTIAVDQRGGRGGVCFGDSGGPMLITQAGAEAIAGVSSFAAPTSLCNVFGAAGRVSFTGTRAEFIDKVVAGKRPRLKSLLLRRRGLTPGLVRDTYLASDAPDTNFGERVDLLVGAPPGTSAIRRALVRFDLSGLPAGATVLTARVGFHMESTSNAGTIAVHRVTNDWDEMRATWRSFGEGGFDPTPFVTFSNATAVVGATEGLWFDVTPLVEAWASRQAENYGILIREPDHEQTQLLSSEIGRFSERPWIHLCYLAAQR